MFQFIINRGRRSRRVGLLLTAAALIVVAGVYHHKIKPRHFAVVEDGVLYRSGLLNPDNLKKVLNRYGIKTVVDLSADHHPNAEHLHQEEARICREKGVDWIPLSLPAKTPPTCEQLTQWLDLLENPGRHPILVHCTHGVVRTGMMVAIYETEFKGADNRQVFSKLPTFGHDLNTPRYEDVKKFILNYAPSGKRTQESIH